MMMVKIGSTPLNRRTGDRVQPGRPSKGSRLSAACILAKPHRPYFISCSCSSWVGFE